MMTYTTGGWGFFVINIIIFLIFVSIKVSKLLAGLFFLLSKGINEPSRVELWPSRAQLT